MEVPAVAAIKRRRVYCPESKKRAEDECSVFGRKYLNHIVPALLKIKQNKSSNDDDDNKEKVLMMTRYEVEMAMVVSAEGNFAWSNALKRKLLLQEEQGHHGMVMSSSSESDHHEMSTSDHEKDDDDDEQLKRLRRLIPGGEDMCDDQQMLSEFNTYITCLQMQVNILHSLVSTL